MVDLKNFYSEKQRLIPKLMDKSDQEILYLIVLVVYATKAR